MKKLFAPAALLPEGWRRGVVVDVDERGAICAVEVDADRPTGEVEVLDGVVLPGMSDAHSHAFQRAFAGRAERRGPAGHSDDSFWTWREQMYALAGRLTPEHAEAIATHLQIELLRHGYTALGEFHYLHHDLDGRPHDDFAEMSARMIAAAERSGVALTLLPTLYAFGGFGRQPASARQQRFLHDVEGFGRLLEALRDRHPEVRRGAAFHSLRAVDPVMLAEGLTLIDGLDPEASIHIHIAEQPAEVEACRAWSGGVGPVEWLLDHAPVDERWSLVHATHATHAALDEVARRGATVVLCPTTEASLGDGVFPAARFMAAGGRFAIGSDSHVCVDPFEELRLLEYGQRLTSGRRVVLATDARSSVGAALYLAACEGGACSLGRDAGGIRVGARADLIVVDQEGPDRACAPLEDLLDLLVFAPSSRGAVRHVMVDGRWVVRDGRHPLEDEAREAFVCAQRALLGR